MIQINIPFPKSCSECELRYKDSDWDYTCPLIGGFYDGFDSTEKRHNDCPLIEVKENKQ